MRGASALRPAWRARARLPPHPHPRLPCPLFDALSRARADGALLVYDITDEQSFRRVQDWVKELRKMLGEDIVIAIAGEWGACMTLPFFLPPTSPTPLTPTHLLFYFPANPQNREQV